MTYFKVERLVKESFRVEPNAYVVLTYQWPQYMLMKDGKDAPPVSIMTDDNVSLFVTMRAEIEQLNMCLTILEEAGKEPSVMVCTNMDDGGNDTHVVVDYYCCSCRNL